MTITLVFDEKMEKFLCAHYLLCELNGEAPQSCGELINRCVYGKYFSKTDIPRKRASQALDMILRHRHSPEVEVILDDLMRTQKILLTATAETSSCKP